LAKSAYQILKFRITSVAPLLMHNGRLADPLNPYSKSIAELSGKKGKDKTESDHLELGRREFYGGIYMDKDGPIIPGEMIEASMIKGAMKEKRGPAAKAGMLVRNHAKLEYKGPRTLDELWGNPLFQFRTSVKVGQSRIVRVRPMFPEWSAEIVVDFIPSLLNAAYVRNFLITAGEQIGIGDWRPRYGRFVVS
jgi:hypothetical protein